ncbi:MAG: hypothetical protein D8M59_15670 [Planctomycetes bacterium]|nr:hypothetical protein [Planctomycetota bacterium]
MRRLPVDVDELTGIMNYMPAELLDRQCPYLDLETGNIVWVWESDLDYAETLNAPADDNAANAALVESNPERFAEVPDLGPADDNAMLKEFLGSDWTPDQSLWQWACDAYRGSVGRWRRAVRGEPDVIKAWHEFEAQATRSRALEFLADNDIEPHEPQ